MPQKPRIFRLFVSSTFSDMVAERNALQEHVFPHLRQFCEARGARFQAIDLRWGISQEAGLNQRATDVCLNEIARCQRMTNRPNFLLLIGDRYGWQPLPDDIPAAEWDMLVPRISDVSDQALLNEWYKRDDNALPPVYVLQPRWGEYVEQNAWNAVETLLHQILLNALNGLNWSHEQRMKYKSSVTEQEIETGIFRYTHAQQGAFCFFRTIDGLPADARGFTDPTNEARMKLSDLKQRLREHIPGNIHHYDAQWIGDSIVFDEAAFCHAVEQTLREAIEAELTTFEDISPLEVEEEMHRRFMIEHTRHFVGRISALDAVAHYLASDENTPLVLHGQSGVGKSTIMAKASEQAGDALVRFVGITPEASDIRSLLINICQSIQARYDLTDAIPQDHEELIKVFPAFLAHASATKPLVIFLDALDQLAHSNTPSNLRWLPNELPPHVKLVMSVISGPYLDALKRRLPGEALVEVALMRQEDGETLLDALLHDAGRTLQPAQRADVLNKFAQNGLPLYLKLAFEEAKLWHSYKEDFTLQPDVPSLLEGNLFARLSDNAEHGAMLISRSLAYLQASRNGLSESEILEVLTRDREFWADFEARSHESQRVALKIVKLLPTAVWSRLYFDLEPYLVERGADGAVLLALYHRQFSEVVDALYLASEREQRHAHLANYFAAQELYPNGVSNARKVAEQAYQQAKAALHEAYVATLTDYPYLQACLDVRGVQALIEDCDHLPDDPIISLVRSTLNLSVHVLTKAKHLLPDQLYGRLWDIHHEPKLAALRTVCASKLSLVPLCPPLERPGGMLLRTLTGHTRRINGALELRDGRLLSWASWGSWTDDTTLRLWTAHGTPLSILTGHEKAVQSGLELQNGQLVSWAQDGSSRIWNADGTLFKMMSGHTDGVLELHDGRLFSWSHDGALRFWTAEGTLLTEIESWFGGVVGAIELRDKRLLMWSGKRLVLWSSDIKHLRTTQERDIHVSDVIELRDGRLLSWCKADSYPADTTLCLWNTDGTLFTTLTGHTSRVIGALEFQDGRILSWSPDRTLRFWEADGTPQLTVNTEARGGIPGVLKLQDGRILTWAEYDSKLKLWTSYGVLITTLDGHEGGVIKALELTDGRILSWGKDETVRLWTLEGALQKILKGQIGGIGLHNRRILSWASDGTLKLWSLDHISPSEANEHNSPVAGIVALRNGSLLSWSSNENALHLWDSNGVLLAELNGHTGRVNGASELSQKRLLSWSDDGTLHLWTVDGKHLVTLEGHKSHVNGVLELRDGNLLSWSGDYTLRLWSADGRWLEILTGHKNSVNGALELKSGNLLSWAGGIAPDNVLRVWSRMGRLEAELAHDNGLGVMGALELRDGRVLSWAGGDAPYTDIRIWTQNGDTLVAFKGPRDGISGALELPDGRLLAWFKTLDLWAEDGTLVNVLDELDWGNRSRIYDWAARQGFNANNLYLKDLVLPLGRVYSEGMKLLAFNPVDMNTRVLFVGDARFTTQPVVLADKRTLAVGDSAGRALFLRYIGE
jgi:hypothetical protein